MKEMKARVSTEEIHQDANCLGLIFLCQKIEQGWILDRYHRRAFTIEQLASGLSDVKTLRQKPKFIVIQESGEGKYRNKQVFLGMLICRINCNL